MHTLNRILDKARCSPRKIILPEGEDQRILAAGIKAHQSKVAEITLLGDENIIVRHCEQAGLDCSALSIINPNTSSKIASYAEILFQAREKKGMTLDKAQELITNPLYYAMISTRAGDSDACVAGAVYSTADVVRTALQLVGKHQDYELASSCFIMLLDKDFHAIKGPLIFSDCGLNITPDAEQLAQIALASSQTAKSLLDLEPVVAMLSFSTQQSANHPLVDKVIKATELIRKANPNLKVIGEVQLDAALIPDIYRQKTADSSHNDSANVLIFPNLEAGNIGYKLVERLAQAEAIGPILQGLKQPVNDLSRGCKAEDIFNTIAVTVVQAQADK